MTAEDLSSKLGVDAEDSRGGARCGRQNVAS